MRGPSPWTPAPALSVRGCAVSAPLSLLMAEGGRFAASRGSGEGGQTCRILDRPLTSVTG
eukprot:8859928-Pyramimonas_sp.AAC.1